MSPKNGKHPILTNAVLLGQKRFTCKRAHTYQAPQPWRYTIQIGPPGTPNNTLLSPPMCPWCFLDAMAFKFPSWDANKTQQEAVNADELGAQTLDMFGGE